MVTQLSQSVAYICPTCSLVSGKPLSVFNFSGSTPIKLSCGSKSCNEEIAQITESNNKYNITIDCAFCGYTHSFAISKSSFWVKDIFSFSCPITDMNIFYLGNSDEIEKHIKEQEQELTKLSEEFAAEVGISIFFDLLSEINDLLEENLIRCECGSDEITIDVNEDGILLCCDECGISNTIKPTEEEYENIVNSGEIILTK